MGLEGNAGVWEESAGQWGIKFDMGGFRDSLRNFPHFPLWCE